MICKTKAGRSFLLPVRIEDESFAQISAIEFLFKQDKKGPALKSAYWSTEGTSRDCERREGENLILVQWTREESYRFVQNEYFYMDTRIHYEGSDMNPPTPIIQLKMTETLFDNGKEVGPDG